jgi:hypothetical protein
MVIPMKVGMTSSRRRTKYVVIGPKSQECGPPYLVEITGPDCDGWRLAHSCQ